MICEPCALAADTHHPELHIACLDNGPDGKPKLSYRSCSCAHQASKSTDVGTGES